MSRRSTSSQPVALEPLLASLRARLTADKFLRLSSLTRLGVPKAQHAEAAQMLCAQGYEATRTGVRVPLRAQLLARLQEAPAIPFPQLAKVLRGVTAREAKAAAEELAAEGLAAVVLRGKAVALAALSQARMERAELALLREVGALAAKALRKPRHTLLREDVREHLLDLLGQAARPAQPAQPQRAGESLDTLVLAELARHVRPTVGLAYVPAAVRALAGLGVPQVHAALLDAARAGRIELQPESGLGRLSAEELDLCPPGPQGTRLSWARLLGELA